MARVCRHCPGVNLELCGISEQFLVGAVVIPLGFYVCVFVFSSWPDLQNMSERRCHN